MRKKQFLIFLCSYIMIVVLYTTLLLSVTLHKNKNFSFIENNYKNELFLSKLSSHVDEKINIGLSFVDDLSKSSPILDYANTKNNDYFLITSIFDDLKESFNNLISPYFSVGFTKLNDFLVITPQSTQNYERFLKSININSNKIPHLPLLFKDKTKSSYYVIPKSMYTKKSNDINIIRKVDYLSEPVYYFLTIHIDDLIKSFYLNNSSVSLSLFTDELVYNSTLIDDSLINDVLLQSKDKLVNINKYEVSSFYSNKLYNYSIQSQSLPNMNYLYSVDEALLYTNLTYLSKDIILLNIILLIAGILIIYFMLKKTYNPINNILKLFNIEDISNTNNKSLIIDEFEFIKNNIVALSSDNQELSNNNKLLQEVLENSRVNLQENFLRKLIYGLLQEDSTSKSIADLKLTSLINGGILCLLEIDGLSKIESTFSKDDILSFRSYLLSKFKSNNNFNIFIVPIDFKKYCLIFDILEKEIIQNKINDIISSLEIESTINITSYIATAVNDISGFCNAFTEASTLLEDNYLFNSNKVINIDNISDPNGTIYSYPFEVEKNIISYIEKLNIEKALDLLSDILDKNSHLDIYNTNNLKYALLNTIKRLLNHKEKTLRQFYEDNKDILDKFSKCSNNELTTCSTEIFSKIFESYFKHNLDDIESPVVANILLYIQKNFHKDISLSTVSDEFNLSEGYISKLLKDSANVNFKNYLNTIRVKKAKELLFQGNYKVSEVGKMVGFENTSSFIRMFKKYELISPGEYLKLISINNINIDEASMGNL